MSGRDVEIPLRAKIRTSPDGDFVTVHFCEPTEEPPAGLEVLRASLYVVQVADAKAELIDFASGLLRRFVAAAGSLDPERVSLRTEGPGAPS